MRGTKEKQILGRSAPKSGKEVHAQSGITLIVLIVSIIVMLILAGVSINAIVGDNGIITQAISAAEATKVASIKEDMEYMFLNYNLKSSNLSIITFLNEKLVDGEIDGFKAYPIDGAYKIILNKDGYYFYIEEVNGEYIATLMDTDTDNITAGITVIAEDSFDSDSGTLTFDIGNNESVTVLFYDEIDAEYNFDIISGIVTIYITADMTLTNEGLSRSAVDVHEGATLNLYISDGVTMTVDSGVAQEGSTGTAGTIETSEGGEGGYAGIHVPEGATLNLYGDGTLYAYGGRASDGGSGVSASTSSGSAGGIGGGRRWSELELELVEMVALVEIVILLMMDSIIVLTGGNIIRLMKIQGVMVEMVKQPET